MNASEWLQRKKEISTRYLSPRPIRDSGLFTQIIRYKSSVRVAPLTGPLTNSRCCVQPGNRQAQNRSSEFVTASAAGCAICASAPITGQVELPCCPQDDLWADLDTKPLALRGTEKCPCPVPGRPELAPPSCCRTPGNINTSTGVDINPRTIAPARCACKPYTAPIATTQQSCCGDVVVSVHY
jgi:hypothetical protein